jgi:hypothetical protein
MTCARCGEEIAAVIHEDIGRSWIHSKPWVERTANHDAESSTPLDNNNDKMAKERPAKVWGLPLLRSQQTHCKRGHEFTPENTIVTARGHRSCKECGRANSRQYYATHGPSVRPMIVCDDCGQIRPHRAHGRCSTCDMRWRRGGGGL